MKHIDNILYFVPRESINFFITVDSTLVTSDNNIITVDSLNFSELGSFKIELMDKLTKEVITPDFEWVYEKDFIKVTFAETYKGIYSMHAYTLEGTIYKGSFSNDNVKTEIINDKIYL